MSCITVEQRHFVWLDLIFFIKTQIYFFQIMNLSCLSWFFCSLILSQHLSLADEPLEKYNDEEFGIEAGEDETKEFKTKVWFIR